ncbi:M28 family peptidase [Leadbettera azotonutricia]|uniref:Peptidase M28 domain-containing protein n=1 Tax=Leadbettera azotonutricia (strain ATCC BAA-888 / DSM 13862 / ZAS-9) TaxID=545695 RepID=F5Y8B2_LEAAZ|nr:M28 family peptidase [Leadbettera azotonutricia]AEF82964.1 conserved hypothetical protein [Leadbettera azotonutricia ZAS-9]
MSDAYMGIPWGHFKKFIALEADRFALLQSILEEAGLEYKIATISGNRHFFVAPPPPEEEFLRRRLTILVAHYDRTPGSPGANDNSASVFILIETAMKLMKAKANNWLIIFSDKEELKPGETIQDQGAYTLASGFRDAGMENAWIYSFDACGTGDTLIISNTVELMLKGEGNQAKEKIRASIQELREKALVTARDLRMGKVLLAPTPFSDDAGFFRAGVAAQTITMLPSEECANLVSTLRRNPQFAEALISQEEQELHYRRLIPETWRSLNSPSDSHLRLTPQNFRTVVRFAEALCKG